MNGPARTASWLLALLLLLLFLAACAKNVVLECQTPFIPNEDGCCLDDNGDGVCDPIVPNGTNTTVLVAEPTAAVAGAELPAPEKQVPSQQTEEEKEALARPFAADVALRWSGNDWDGLYLRIPAKERAVLTDKRFRFLMRLYDPDLAVDNDPKLNYVFKTDGFDGFAEDRMAVDNVTVSGDAARVDVKVWVRNVRIPYGPLNLVWEDGGWRVRANGTFYQGTSAESACPATGYADYCFSEYAQEFDSIEYCVEAGVHVAECYAYFHEKPPASVVIKTCSQYSRKWQNDECLLAIALETADEELCPPMDFEYDTYRCLGIIAGFQGDMSLCLDEIDTQSNTAGYNEDNCYYGSALATRDTKQCKHDWTDDTLRSECYKIR